MAVSQERGTFILDLDLTSAGHLFLQENSLNGRWVGLKGVGGVLRGGRRVWRDGGGGEVSGVN